MSDIRVADTPTLIRLVENAKNAGLRNVPSYTTMKLLDSYGFHVLTLLKAWDRYDPSTSKPYHHRVHAVIKLSGGRPDVSTLDVVVNDWGTLPVATDLLRSQAAFRRLNQL